MLENIDKNKMLERAQKTKLEYVHSTLKEIELLSPTQIVINHETCRLSHTALESLCNLLLIKSDFIFNIESDNINFVSEIAAKIESQDKDSHIILCITASKEVLDIKVNTMNMVSNELLVNSILGLDMIDKLDLRRMSIQGSGLSMTFTDPDSDFSPIQTTSGQDVYRRSLNFSSSQTGQNSVKILDSVERMICTNLTYMKMNSHSRAIRIGDRDYDHVINDRVNTWYKDDSIKEFVTAKVKQMDSVCASYAECDSVYKPLSKLTDSNNQCIIEDLNKVIPMNKLANAYGGEYPLNKNDVFKGSARTNVKYYDLFNYVTNLGTHSKVLSNSVKDRLLLSGGAMMNKTPDILNIAPEVVMSLV